MNVVDCIIIRKIKILLLFFNDIVLSLLFARKIRLKCWSTESIVSVHIFEGDIKRSIGFLLVGFPVGLLGNNVIYNHIDILYGDFINNVEGLPGGTYIVKTIGGYNEI